MNGAAQSGPRGIERGWPYPSSPFHPGEQQVQSYIGVRKQVERGGRYGIRSEMPDDHRQLFEALPMLIVGSLDAAGQPWASILAGEPGFVRSPSPKLLHVSAEPSRGDPLTQNLRRGAALGLLGIQLGTRRRNRANGHVLERGAHSFTLGVEQSFGNCKKYIQAREPTFDPALRSPARIVDSERARLSARAKALLARTDTFFIATASAAAASSLDGEGSGAHGEGVDVSHRGGRPGFVRVTEGARATELTVPDFSGNFMFNTLGNLQVNPRAGIVCADFESGDVLSLTGTARVLWDGPAVSAFPGAERLLTFAVESGVFLERSLPLRFSGLAPSPHLADTGTWAELAPR